MQSKSWLLRRSTVFLYFVLMIVVVVVVVVVIVVVLVVVCCTLSAFCGVFCRSTHGSAVQKRLHTAHIQSASINKTIL